MDSQHFFDQPAGNFGADIGQPSLQPDATPTIAPPGTEYPGFNPEDVAGEAEVVMMPANATSDAGSSETEPAAADSGQQRSAKGYVALSAANESEAVREAAGSAAEPEHIRPPGSRPSPRPRKERPGHADDPDVSSSTPPPETPSNSTASKESHPINKEVIYGPAQSIPAVKVIPGRPGVHGERKPHDTEDVPRIDEFAAPKLSPGTRVAIMPSIGVHDHRTAGHILEEPTPEVCEAQVNTFLEGLSRQGAEIVGTRNVVVDALEEWQNKFPGSLYNRYQSKPESRTGFVVECPERAPEQPAHEFRAVVEPVFGRPDVRTTDRVLCPLPADESAAMHNAFIAGVESDGWRPVARLDGISLNMIEHERDRVPTTPDIRRSETYRTGILIVRRNIPSA